MRKLILNIKNKRPIHWVVFMILGLFFSQCSNRDQSERQIVQNNKGNIQTPELTVISIDSLPIAEEFELPAPIIRPLKPGEKITANIKRDNPYQPHYKPFDQNSPADLVLLKDFPPPFKIKAENDHVSETSAPFLIDVKNAYIKTENHLSFSFYTRSEGLPNDDISAMVEDEKGNLWIGTYTGGLVRYDGTFFSHYTTENGLLDNDILSLLIDRDGNLWIGTRFEGVSKFDGQTFTHYTTREGLSHNSVESIYQDAEGNMWFGTSGGGVNFYDGEYFTHYTTRQGLARDIVYTIQQDDKGTMWFGTRGGGLSSFDGEIFRTFNKTNGLVSDYIIFSTKDSEGKLWFSSDGEGISVINDNEIINFEPGGNFEDGDVLCLYEDSKNRMWIGTRQSGLYHYKDNTLTHYNSSHGLINEYITWITEDSSGHIWFGTFGSGIGIFHGDLFQHYAGNEGIADSFIRSINQDTKGNMWFASFLNGLYKFDGNTFTNFTTKHGLPEDRVRYILPVGNTLWVSMLSGWIAKIDDQTVESYDLGEITQYSGITNITQDPSGNFWLSTHGGGILKLSGQKITRFTKYNGLADNYVRKIVTDRNGNIWIANRTKGVSKFDGKTFTHFELDSSARNVDIRDIMVDSNGLVWLATNGKGIYVLDQNKSINFTVQNGLGSNFLYSLLEDQNNNIWMGTRRGLSKLIHPLTQRKNLLSMDSTVLSNKISFKNYSKTDGFLGVGANSRSIFQDSNGTIWVGANDILTSFFPDNDLPDQIKPNIQLTDVNLFNEKISWEMLEKQPDTTFALNNGVVISNLEFDSISSWYGIPNNLILNYTNNYLVFKYVGITMRFKDQIRYRFMLEGLEENWNSPTRRNEAHYSNLSPGNYIFKVKSINSEGIESEKFQYSFIIKPPWWKSNIAYATYAVAVVLLLIANHFYNKKRRKKKEKRKIEELQMQQEIEIARKSVEFKKNFLANMSHEIRTPLTGILGMTEILNKTNLTDQQKEYLQTISQSGENLREIINLVLDYSKIEAGKLKITYEDIKLARLVSEADTYFRSICKKDIAFTAEINPALPEWIRSDGSRIMQILRNLISNAVKFTEKGSVTLKILPAAEVKAEGNGSTQMLRMEVIDTGQGISKNQQKNLFKPFYQVEQSYDRSYDGTGLGLSICKELTQLLKGEMGVDSQPGKGSRFWFTFAYQQAEKSQDQKNEGITPNQKTSAENSLRILLVEDK
ncbi:MAG: sensor histidine kinase, partial [Bacteroidota bacterium]